MEKTKIPLQTSLRVVIIAIIIIVLIFLSFLMVSIVPKVLSSMANATVSVTSAFFPADKQNTNGANTSAVNSTSSGVSLNNNNSTSTSTGNFLTNFFGPRKDTNNESNNSEVNFTVATSSRNNGNNSNSNNTNNSNNRNNNYQRVIGTPDLAVQIISVGTMTNGVFVTTNNFTSNDTVVVKFMVENKGTGPTGAWSMRVDMPSTNTNDKVKTITANSIPVGAVVTGQAIFNTPAVGTNQKIVVSVDPNGVIVESNKNNNQSSVSINVTQLNNYYNYNNGYNYNNNYNYNYNCINGYVNGVYTNCNNYNNNYNNYNSLPNLTVRMVSVGKVDVYNQFTQDSYIRSTDRVAVRFEVTNNSTVYTSSWTWNARLVGPAISGGPYPYYNSYNNSYTNGYTYNSDGSRTYTPSIIESGLAPNETRSYTVTFDSLTYGSNYITVTVDSANAINESNEGDNTISQSFFVSY